MTLGTITRLCRDAARSAQAAAAFEEQGDFNSAYRALGIAEGLNAAAAILHPHAGLSPDLGRELRSARNAHRAAVVAANGFTSGVRVQNLRITERTLRDLLWRHRDLLIEAVSEPI